MLMALIMPAPPQTSTRPGAAVMLRASRRWRARCARCLRRLRPKAGTTGCPWRNRTLELTMRPHWEHRRRPTLVVDREVAIAPVAPTVVTAGKRAEHETGEEDHCDDEDDARD